MINVSVINIKMAKMEFMVDPEVLNLTVLSKRLMSTYFNIKMTLYPGGRKVESVFLIPYGTLIWDWAIVMKIRIYVSPNDFLDNRST